MSGFFDAFLERTTPPAEVCVDLSRTLRIWFRVETDWGALVARKASVNAQFKKLTVFDDNGNFKSFKGLHPSWRVPSTHQSLFGAITLDSIVVRGEELVEGEWVAKKVGLPDFLALTSRAVLFDAFFDRVSAELGKHAAKGEDEAYEQAKKKPTETPDGSPISESDSG